MKKNFLKILITLPLALILCLGIMLSLVPHTGEAETVSTATFSAPLTPDDDLYKFADALITSWFDDCLGYIDENNPAYEELEAEFENIKAELNSRDDLDNLGYMLVFITSSYNRLDKIYYLWECNTYSEELESAYKEIKDSGAYSGNSEKIDTIYIAVRSLISAFEKELNPEDSGELDNTDLSLINARVNKSSEIETALEKATTDFKVFEQEWKQRHDLIFWLSISGGILLLAAVIVIILLLIMKKRNKKYAATLISLADLQKVLDDENFER